MGFWTWFSLKGRISRLTSCIFYFLIPNGIIFAASILDTRVLPKNSMPAALGKGMGELSVVSALALLLGLWLSLAGQVKRWHDQDRTGWWGCLTALPTLVAIWHLFYGGGAGFYFILQFGFPLVLLLFLAFSSDDSNANQFILLGIVFLVCFFYFFGSYSSSTAVFFPAHAAPIASPLIRWRRRVPTRTRQRQPSASPPFVVF